MDGRIDGRIDGWMDRRPRLSCPPSFQEAMTFDTHVRSLPPSLRRIPPKEGGREGPDVSFEHHRLPEGGRTRQTRTSIHPAVYPSIYLSVHLSVRPSVHPSVHRRTRPSRSGGRGHPRSRTFGESSPVPRGWCTAGVGRQDCLRLRTGLFGRRFSLTPARLQLHVATVQRH